MGNGNGAAAGHVQIDGEVVTDTSLSGAIIELDGASDQGLAISLSRAEIDIQISTARRYPRSIDRAIKNICALATLDDLTAEECIYALPRGGKPIVGPSARFAEIVFSQWGNARVASRVVQTNRDERWIEAEGIYHDLETNVATVIRTRRRIEDKKGRLLNSDMINVTGNAAAAIAKRNAILSGVPRAVWRSGYQQVEMVLKGDAETLTVRREKTMKAFAAFGLTPEQVCGALGVAGVGDIGLDHMPILRGMYAALKSGETTVEEVLRTATAAASPGGVRPPSASPFAIKVPLAAKPAAAATPAKPASDPAAKDDPPKPAQAAVADQSKPAEPAEGAAEAPIADPDGLVGKIIADLVEASEDQRPDILSSYDKLIERLSPAHKKRITDFLEDGVV
jgi:hypothetical protein